MCIVTYNTFVFVRCRESAVKIRFLAATLFIPAARHSDTVVTDYFKLGRSNFDLPLITERS